jgi:hypothetical protein
MIRLWTTLAKSEADSAVLRAKPDNAVASMILIGELLLSSCRSTHRRHPPKRNQERWTEPLHGGLIPTLHLVGKSIPRFRIGHLYEVYAVPTPRPHAAEFHSSADGSEKNIQLSSLMARVDYLQNGVTPLTTSTIPQSKAQARVVRTSTKNVSRLPKPMGPVSVGGAPLSPAPAPGSGAGQVFGG